MESNNFLYVLLAVVVLLGGYTFYTIENDKNEKIENDTRDCHDLIHKQAKHSAKIIETEVGSDSITGRAQLQNGFGAWTNYTYYCSTLIGVHEAKLIEGW